MELPKALTCNPPQIDWSDSNLYIVCAISIFNPLFWNCIARYEYKTQFMSKICMGPKNGCILLGVTILFLGALTLRRYQLVLDSQPQWPLLLDNPYALYTAYTLIGIGTLLAVTSFFVLGFFGSSFGDSFGILMEERITGFPFNTMDNPMYWGTVMGFLGTAIRHASPVGLLVTLLLCICYKVAIWFEEPYTAEIYRKKAEEEIDKKDN